MQSILLTIALGIVAFTVTNVNDVFVLVMFFSNPSFSTNQVVIGQYIGVSLLITISAFSYFAAFIVPYVWIRLRGIFPIIIGEPLHLVINRLYPVPFINRRLSVTHFRKC